MGKNSNQVYSNLFTGKLYPFSGPITTTSTADSSGPNDTTASISTPGGLSVAKTIATKLLAVNSGLELGSCPVEINGLLVGSDQKMIAFDTGGSRIWDISLENATNDFHINRTNVGAMSLWIFAATNNVQIASVDPAVDSGYKFQVPAGGAFINALALTNAGGNAGTLLNYYDEQPLIPIAFGGFIATSSFQCTRVGRSVTITVTAVASTGAAATAVSTTPIPAQFRPAVVNRCIIPAVQNSVGVVGLGEVDASGIIVCTANITGAGPGFTGVGIQGWNTFSMCYQV